ncbi:MAG: hypothetical protein ABI442_10490 [Gemmatimonadaceae bacterium]
MLQRIFLSRSLWVAALLLTAGRVATAQRFAPAALSVHNSAARRVILSDRIFSPVSTRTRSAEDSVKTRSERLAGVIGGAIVGAATGFAVAAVYAPRIYCDLCQPGNAPAEARNKYFFRGPVIGGGVGALAGWWFYSRN